MPTRPDPFWQGPGGGCDPIFDYYMPVDEGFILNNQNEIKNVKWCKRQFIYLDAQVAPLPYGKKTYFYGENENGNARVTFDYHSFTSSAAPGLINEITFLTDWNNSPVFGIEKFAAEDTIKNTWGSFKSEQFNTFLTKTANSWTLQGRQK